MAAATPDTETIVSPTRPTAPAEAAPVASLPLSKLHGLTDIELIKEQLAILKLEEASIDADLDSMLKGQTQVDSTLNTLELLRPQMHSLHTDTDGLLRIIDKTWGIAQGISEKVRQLDLEQSRVKITLELLNIIQELKACAYGAHMAIINSDLETGAFFIHKYLQFNIDSIQDIFNQTTLLQDTYSLTSTSTSQQLSISLEEAAASTNMSIPTNPDNDSLGLLGPSPVTQLNNAQDTLTTMAMDAFDAAVRAENSEGILRCFKIFPLMGKVDLGLDIFSAYVCRSVSRSSQDGMRAATESGKRALAYVDLLTRLFEAIATMIDRQSVMVETHYGSGRMLPVIVRLQREADIQSSILLGGLKETRQLERKVKEIQQFENISRRKPQKASSGAADNQHQQPPVDPRELDMILGEIATICQKSHFFDRFLRLRATDQVYALRADPSADLDKLPPEGTDGLQQTSNLNEQMHTFIGYYISIEDYFIRQSIEKALKIDEHDPSALTSSCVDDVFFILETSIRRGISTSDTECLAALINSIDRLLEVEFMNALQRRLSLAFVNTGSGSGGSSASGSGAAGSDTHNAFMTTLNNIDVSCEYTIKLAREVETLIIKAFSHARERDVEKIKSCLSALTEHALKFRNILKTWIENFFNQTVKPRVRPLMMGVYADTKYILNEDEYNHQDTTQTMLKRFTNAFTKLAVPYKNVLTEGNYGMVVGLIIDSIAKDFERHLLTFNGGGATGSAVGGSGSSSGGGGGVRFNQLGALRLDKDIRGMTAFLSDTTRWSTRDKFNRLGQISMVLNAETVEEVYEFWGVKAGPISWRLSSNEVRKILGQR
ncbi:hypothetical protein BSLG_010017 [Batrachochytrium salamandrivorans]|nr:hypothetical protein BSLG_010017 [Batrachochytrium salamandrivorans]